MLRIMLLCIIISALTLSPVEAQQNPGFGESITPTTNVGPPVEIDYCALLYRGGWLLGKVAGVKIQFTNDSQKVADLINFLVASGSQGGQIRDVGTFTPGIEITHTYKSGQGQMMFAPIFSHPHINCSVVAVRFTDGTIWRANQRAVVPTATSTDNAVSGPIELSQKSLSFTSVGRSEGQFLTVTDSAGSVTESDNCKAVATVTVISRASRSRVYRIDPLSMGDCGMTMKDDEGNSAFVPIGIRPPSPQ